MDLLLIIDCYDFYGKVVYFKQNQVEDVYVLFCFIVLFQGVFINLVLMEFFGLILIEVVVCGVFIVVMEDGGLVDIIKNCQNGYLINFFDEVDIVDKLFKVLNDK